MTVYAQACKYAPGARFAGDPVAGEGAVRRHPGTRLSGSLPLARPRPSKRCEASSKAWIPVSNAKPTGYERHRLKARGWSTSPRGKTPISSPQQSRTPRNSLCPPSVCTKSSRGYSGSETQKRGHLARWLKPGIHRPTMYPWHAPGPSLHHADASTDRTACRSARALCSVGLCSS